MAPEHSSLLPDRVGWDNWGELFTDIELWRPVVRSICRQAGLTPPRRISAGYPGTCAVFEADARIVVKIYPPFLEHDFHREREAYRLMDDRVPKLPRPLAQGIFKDRLDWPYLILSYMPGEPIRTLRDRLSPRDLNRLGQELGRIIRAVHVTPLTNALYFDTSPDTWQRFLQERRTACLAEVAQRMSLPDRVLAEAELLLDSLALVPDDFRPVLISADLTEDHLLLISRGGHWHISALIDWADAEAGSPEYEWAALWFDMCRQDRDLFRQVMTAYDPHIALDDQFRRRAMAFTFLHRFGAEIIELALSQHGGFRPYSLDELIDHLWPRLD